MFNFFKKSPSFRITDKVWKTSNYAWRGMATDAMRIITQREIPIIVCYFNESKKRLFTYLSAQGIPCYELNPETVANSAYQSKVIFCVNAFEAEPILKSSLLEKMKIHFLFESHYPLPEPEQKLTEALFALTQAPVFTFYLSIDGPLMQIFDSGNLIPLMEKMGLKDDECVEHRMVSSAIRRAQEKISEHVGTPFEVRTPSEKEWYDRNARKRV
ncbi:MAG: hypothetical protein DI538_00035 [Azospira oryzae]|jgi:hypothetical protein|nr:MAG: hypothetical protein DI538_00035 [Azospira oryzae]